jgi:AP2-associated kinase
MLREDPKARPNIYQFMREVCAMRGTDVPIKDVSLGAIISTL